MGKFKLFIEASDIRKLPNSIEWIRGFFEKGLDVLTLKIWGDQLEENGLNQAADFFHTLGWRNPKLKRGEWNGRLVGLFYEIFGHYADYVTMYDVNEEMQGSWFFHERERSGGRPLRQMSRHIVHSEHTSYRLALTNGKWSAYTNNDSLEVGVVGLRHAPTEDSERYFPQGRITLKDYKPVAISDIPETLLLCAFYKLIEKQVRGGR